LYSNSQLMLYFRIVVLMYPVSVITHMLNILDSFNMGVTIWYQSRSIQIVPWVIKNTIQVVVFFESKIIVLNYCVS